jgi:hypothetical protein
MLTRSTLPIGESVDSVAALGVAESSGSAAALVNAD